jgi:PAS domain S-box-containing protein
MDGRILDVNGAAVASLGYAKRNLVGKPIWELDPAVEPAEWAARREKIRSSGGMTFTSDHRCADGSLSPVEIAASHLEFEGEEFVVAFTRNIRERLQVERAVERSEADFRGLFEKAPYGIFRRTAEGQILMANPAFAEMLGYGDPGDLVSLRMGRDIWAEEEEWEEMAGRALDEAGLGGVHVTWKRRDGARITVRLYSRLVKNEEDEVEFFEEMAVDISDRVQLEEQLRQAQKMEAVGQLTGGIAHDFNNLMSVILLNTDLVRNAAESGRPLPMDDLVEVEEAARKAATMTSKLLGFSRRASLTRVPTYLPDIVSNLSSLLRRLLPEDIELRVEAEDPVCPVEADVGSVEQMILNLATNARDAMQSGGRLTLEVGNREVDEDERRDRPWLETGRYVSVGVSDTGVGMGEEVLERIFEPFFTTKPVGEGTGLGMAMVYGLTKQHGGFVTVESERGEGTRVELLFPASEELGLPADPSPEPPSDPPTHGSETILLVEDEAALRRSGKRVLERFGYRVLLAGDGEEGLRVFREGKDEVDLVISDMVMPRSGGADLYRALRDAGESVPFLLVSGYTGDEAMETTMLGPEVPIIPKPWDVNELLGQVRALLD